MTHRNITVIGVGGDGPQGLSGGALSALAECGLIYGSRRQLDFFPQFEGEKRVFPKPLKVAIEDIKNAAKTRSVAVLASGDPLFYGIGSTLLKQCGTDEVTVYPHVSSVQLAFARAGLGWQDARMISLHGRSLQGFAQKLHGAEKAAVLTDENNTPSVIAKYLQAFKMLEYDAFVAERLGGTEERTGWYSLNQLTENSFAALNVLILKRRFDAGVPVFTLGIEDGEFSQRSPDRGLITKREVRVQSLAELRLRKGDVLWDIGACTGSVSIEAILSTQDLQVYAVEKNQGDLANLRENQVKFRADFVAVQGRAPEGLDEFPNPDAVFVGGSGGQLEPLLRLCAGRLRSGGRIVVNAVTIENLHAASRTLKELGFAVSVALIQTARSKSILNLTRFEGMNPVYLVTGKSRQSKGAETFGS